jgi:hypothetical protein
MGRWSHLDSDAERLPHGVVRIGYDADSQSYTYLDTNHGWILESDPGVRYGRMWEIGWKPWRLATRK